jgi:hypothetical protein
MTIGNSRTPFLDSSSFAREEAETQEPVRATSGVLSPFVSVYELSEGESTYYDDPVREAYSTILNELYDEEFDEALFELLTKAKSLHHEHLASGSTEIEAERLLTQHFSHLVRESEAMVDAMARQFGSRDQSTLVDSEIDSFVEGYAPSTPFEPEFENFFGKLIKKVAKGVRAVAGKAWQAAKKVALGPILNQIKALIKPLLDKILQTAIGKLPEAVQPAARKLAAKLGFAVPAPTPDAASDASGAGGGSGAAPADVGTPVQDAPGGDVSEMQLEFNEQIAEALLAENEVELNLEVARVRAQSSAPAAPVFAELGAARERFIQELHDLKEGESPQPHIQNFLPAILPALRIGVRLIGRPKVVNFLAQLLAKLISKLIGPEQAPALSQAIVDAGLKLLSMEMSEQERSGLAASAVAATVEETVSRVASLPNYVLDNQELLEGFALEAFEQAAAANLPALFSDRVYQQRPDLLEGGINAGWVLLPLRGPKLYKGCTRIFKVKITPQMAEEIESFEGAPLSDYLQDQLGLPEGTEAEAEVRLYETLPGTTVADIAGNERETPGLGASDAATISQIHPLTREAAGALLGRPALGRNPSIRSNRWNLAAGQRLYHLAILGRRPLSVPGMLGILKVRKLVRVHVTLDCPQDQVRVCVFISEVKAQRLAVRLRQQSHVGSLTVGFQKLMSRRLPPILHGQRRGRLRIVQAGIAPGPALDAALQKLPAVVPQVFIAKMQEWLAHGFSEFVKTQVQRFVAAADEPVDGVTLVFTIEHPQGLKELCQALVEKGPSGSQIADSIAKGSQPVIRVEVFPGHKCD